MKQFVLTPAMGKRLIGKALPRHPDVRMVLDRGTVVVVAGTTNGYVAEETLAFCGDDSGFRRQGFRRGMTLPPGTARPEGTFTGDVVIVDGQRMADVEIFDVVDDVKAGDVIVKGANAVHLPSRRAAVYIGHPMGGTIAAASPAVIRRRVKVIVPVGLEKRVTRPVEELAELCNRPDTEGPRMMPIPGEVFTELDAIYHLTGCRATLLAGGGVCGAEGAVWIGIEGDASETEAATQLVQSLAGEPPCCP